MNGDFLWTAIIPLGFLAIYALMAITNRDPKPLPGRAPSSNPYGPRPQQPPPPLNRLPTGERSPEIRWAPVTTTAPQPPKPGGLDDDIVIIEPSRPARSPNVRSVTQNRRVRSKPSGSNGSKATNVTPTSNLASVSQSVNQQLASSMVIKPLTETTVAQPVQRSASANASQTLDMEGGNLGAKRIAAAFADRSRVREAIIMSEVLGPPVALRKTRHHR